MKIPHFSKIHNRFKINGYHYNQDDLTQVAYNFIKEGAAFEEVIGVFLLDWLDASETITIQTSGSTGQPKKIKVSKQAMVHSAVRTGEFFDLQVGDRALLCLPVDYIAGKMMLVRAMILGLDLIIKAPKTALDLSGQSFDFCAMVPLQAQKTLPYLSQIKTLLIGGAPLSFDLRQALTKIHPNCFETYGMTETLTHIAVAKINYPPQPFCLLPEINITTSSDSALIVDAPHLSDTPIHTNDIVNILSENEFQLLGRKNNVINSGGKKLFPEQLEQQLGTALAVPFFFASQADVDLGERLVLLVEGTNAIQNNIETALQDVFGLDKLLYPKEIIYFNTFTYTASGKIDRPSTLKKLEAL